MLWPSFSSFPSLWCHPLPYSAPGALFLLPHWGAGHQKLPRARPVRLRKGAFAHSLCIFFFCFFPVCLLICLIVPFRLWAVILCVAKSGTFPARWNWFKYFGSHFVQQQKHLLGIRLGLAAIKSRDTHDTIPSFTVQEGMPGNKQQVFTIQWENRCLNSYGGWKEGTNG